MISIRLCVVLAAAAAAFVGCRSARTLDLPAVPHDAPDTFSGTSPSEILKPAILPGFHEIKSFGGSSLSDDAHIYAARVEGIGTVYAQLLSSSTAPRLVVRREPRDASPMVAYVGSWATDNGGWVSVFAADEPGLIGELARASHEDYGLVADRIQGRWARVVYGYTTRGDARRGWIRLSPAAGIAYISYDDQIRQRITWFVEPASVELFDRPRGRRVPFSLMPSGGEEPSYTLKVLDIRRDWIQVRVAVPDTDPCGGDPDKSIERTTTAWVRRHNAEGRYQIDYAPAGC